MYGLQSMSTHRDHDSVNVRVIAAVVRGITLLVSDQSLLKRCIQFPSKFTEG